MSGGTANLAASPPDTGDRKYDTSDCCLSCFSFLFIRHAALTHMYSAQLAHKLNRISVHRNAKRTPVEVSQSSANTRAI